MSAIEMKNYALNINYAPKSIILFYFCALFYMETTGL
jgi:hypothetical protein